MHAGLHVYMCSGLADMTCVTLVTHTDTRTRTRHSFRPTIPFWSAR